MRSLGTMSRLLRQRDYYSVPVAGSMILLGRTNSYNAAAAGLIPVERDGRLMLVPREKWDRRVKRLRRSLPRRRT